MADSSRSVEPDEGSSENDGRTAFVRVLEKAIHEPSVAIRKKSDVQVHVRANRQSGSEMEAMESGLARRQ